MSVQETQRPVANAWETLSRERKARAIATTLVRVLPSLTADEAAELNGDARRAAAMLARVRPCSDAANLRSMTESADG